SIWCETRPHQRLALKEDVQQLKNARKCHDIARDKKEAARLLPISRIQLLRLRSCGHQRRVLRQDCTEGGKELFPAAEFFLRPIEMKFRAVPAHQDLARARRNIPKSPADFA